MDLERELEVARMRGHERIAAAALAYQLEVELLSIEAKDKLGLFDGEPARLKAALAARRRHQQRLRVAGAELVAGLAATLMRTHEWSKCPLCAAGVPTARVTADGATLH